MASFKSVSIISVCSILYLLLNVTLTMGVGPKGKSKGIFQIADDDSSSGSRPEPSEIEASKIVFTDTSDEEKTLRDTHLKNQNTMSRTKSSNSHLNQFASQSNLSNLSSGSRNKPSLFLQSALSVRDFTSIQKREEEQLEERSPSTPSKRNSFNERKNLSTASKKDDEDDDSSSSSNGSDEVKRLTENDLKKFKIV